ncbi:MAG: hypothetical protein HY360_08135 [Verrucomicrobia bacterium]|nr:hypothetical protein [Verrucomicrobiota bacterium]
MVTNCDRLTRLKFSPVLPLTFTENGAIMAANVEVLQRIMRLLDPPPEPEPPRRQIGFEVRERSVVYRVNR